MQYSVIVFDTAPTGHTLRFLSFPTVLEKALAKVSQLGGRFGPMIQQVSCFFGHFFVFILVLASRIFEVTRLNCPCMSRTRPLILLCRLPTFTAAAPYITIGVICRPRHLFTTSHPCVPEGSSPMMFIADSAIRICIDVNDDGRTSERARRHVCETGKYAGRYYRSKHAIQRSRKFLPS